MNKKTLELLEPVYLQLRQAACSINTEFEILHSFEFISPPSRLHSAQEVIATLWLISAVRAIHDTRILTSTINYQDEEGLHLYCYMRELSPVAAGFLSGYDYFDYTFYEGDIELLNKIPKFVDYLVEQVPYSSLESISYYLSGHAPDRMLPTGENLNIRIFTENPDWLINSKKLISYLQANEIKTATRLHRKRIGHFPEIIEEKLTLLELFHCASPFKYEDFPEDGITIIDKLATNLLLEKIEDDLRTGNTNFGNNETGRIANELLENASLVLPLEPSYISAEMVKELDSLVESFPNFAEVTLYVKEHTSYLAARGLPFKLPNILLIGEPGIGKSAYVTALSKLIDVPSRFIPMPSLSTAAEFTGLASVRGNAQQGLIADHLSQTKCPNPIFVLDEIDKTSDSGGNAVSPKFILLSITEESTASSFMNPFYRMSMDLSHISWIATANHAEDIDGPLLSRFKRFNVPTPNKSEFVQIANSMYRSILNVEVLTDQFEESLSAAVVDELYKSNLREVKEKIQRGVYRSFTGNMQINGKLQLNKSHVIPPEIKRSLL